MTPQDFQLELGELEAKGLRRSLKPVSSPQDLILSAQGKTYLNFSSNNYLGLANRSEVKAAMIAGVERFGAGAGASRLVNGSLEVFHDLERALAEFKGTQAALLFNSGYQANTGALGALAGAGDIIFSDEYNHASLIDGIRLSKAERVVFPHNDVSALRTALKEGRSRAGSGARFWIVTESVFSMDGDLAPLAEICETALEFDAYLYVDEAHATGVFGARGAGLAAALPKRAEMGSRLVQMGTLGKALGCFGAYVAASRDIVDYLINRARPFVFTTALPPAVAAASLKALEIVQTGEELRTDLRRRLAQFSAATGIAAVSPIVPIVLGDPARAVAAAEALQAAGYWVNAIRPPTVPEGTSRLRVTFMATHREADVAGLSRALQEIL